MLFQYTHLARDTIRLVRFLPYSTSTNLFLALEHRKDYADESVHYHALSYKARDTDDRKPITLGGRSFMITASLLAALTDLWQHRAFVEDHWFFVDQLCINQRNDEEKVQQERLLPHIFSSADKVMVWLGPGDEDARAVIDASHRSSGPIASIQQLQEEIIEVLPGKRESIQRLLEKSELQHARQLILFSGGYHCESQAHDLLKPETGNL